MALRRLSKAVSSNSLLEAKSKLKSVMKLEPIFKTMMLLSWKGMPTAQMGKLTTVSFNGITYY